MLLWLPGIDWVRGYQLPAMALRAAVPQPHGCIATRNMNPAQVGLFVYYTRLNLRNDPAGQCALLLEQGGGDNIDPPGNWLRIWEGGRPGDTRERFRLYRRDGQAPIPL